MVTPVLKYRPPQKTPRTQATLMCVTKRLKSLKNVSSATHNKIHCEFAWLTFARPSIRGLKAPQIASRTLSHTSSCLVYLKSHRQSAKTQSYSLHWILHVSQDRTQRSSQNPSQIQRWGELDRFQVGARTQGRASALRDCILRPVLRIRGCRSIERAQGRLDPHTWLDLSKGA